MNNRKVLCLQESNYFLYSDKERSHFVDRMNQAHGIAIAEVLRKQIYRINNVFLEEPSKYICPEVKKISTILIVFKIGLRRPCDCRMRLCFMAH